MTSSRADADRTALEGSVQSMLRKAYDMGISGSPFDIVDEANRLVDVIEDDLLTTRAETEPDEDAVERAASAMWDDNHVRSGRRWEDAEHDQDIYRSMARVALQAAATNADEPDLSVIYMKGYQDGQDADWLETALSELTDDTLPGLTVDIARHDGHWNIQQMQTGLEESSPTDVYASDDSFRKAVMDAVAKAKGQSDDTE